MHCTINYISPTKCTTRQFRCLVTTYYFSCMLRFTSAIIGRLTYQRKHARRHKYTSSPECKLIHVKYIAASFIYTIQITIKTSGTKKLTSLCAIITIYTGCPRRNVQNFGRVFLRSNYTDITQNTYIQSSMVTEIFNIENWGQSGGLFGVCILSSP